MEFGMLGNIAWWVQALVWVFVLICVFLIIIVLLQKGRGGGLSAAFGGAGGQSAFGSKTGDVFTWVTIIITGVFLLLAIVMTRVYRPENVESQFQGALVAPAETTNNAGIANPSKGGDAKTKSGAAQQTGQSKQNDVKEAAAKKNTAQGNSTTKTDVQNAAKKAAADAAKKVAADAAKKAGQ